MTQNQPTPRRNPTRRAVLAGIGPGDRKLLHLERRIAAVDRKLWDMIDATDTPAMRAEDDRLNGIYDKLSDEIRGTRPDGLAGLAVKARAFELYGLDDQVMVDAVMGDIQELAGAVS